jgi:prevent-host-death family protein
MTEVSMRDLRNHGGEVIDRVARGERVTITRSGKPVAELRPLGQAKLSAQSLIDRWRHLSALDPVALRADIDETLDSSAQ